MSDQRLIYHYTDIPTLALILRSGRIRFNRLDRVFDLSEARTGKGIKFGKFLFVSCWTEHADESIPLWRLYTRDLSVVRIGLPVYPFVQFEFNPPPEWEFIKQGHIPSPIPFDEVWSDSHFVVPQFLNRKLFGATVKYTGDIQAVYESSVSIETEADHTTLSVERLYDLPRLKTTAWEFENEYRFALFILPAIPIPPGGPSRDNYEKELPNHRLRCLLEGREPPLTYFDVRLAPEALDEIEVVLGPCCSQGDRLIVESLLERFAAGGSVMNSSFEGTIRAT